MASASLQGLCEEATCSICLEYFQDPVITECGHNFCRACLAKCWEGLVDEVISCPQCREKVQRNVIPNLQLGNVVELAKKLCLQEGKSLEKKEGACGNHQKPLKHFCKNCRVLICEACNDHQHPHQKVTLERAAQDYQLLIGRHLEFLEEERTKILINKTEIEEKSQALLDQTKAEIEKTKEQFREKQSFFDKQEKLLLAHLEKLEKETARKRDDLLARLLEKLSSLGGLIQEMNQTCQKSPGELLQDVSSILQSCEKKQPFQDFLAFRSEQSLEITEVRKTNAFLAGWMKKLKGSLSQSFHQKANVILDPDTAHPNLVLSQDGKSVNWRNRSQSLPNNPERFDRCLYVLGYVGFTGGKRYWEVTVQKEGDWAVGVARNTIRRKYSVDLRIPNYGLDTREGIWAFGKWYLMGVSKYRTSDQPDEGVPSLSENLWKIWVCLNCEEGELEFYNGDTGSHLCTFSGAPFFGETLIPFFHVSEGASLTIIS